MMTAKRIDNKKPAVLKVEDAQGKSHTIASFSEKQRAALVFVRHFGWLFYRQQVAELMGYQHEFDSRNAELTIVDNGKPQDLSAFAKVTGYNGKLFTDPSLESFKVLGFIRNISGLFAAEAVVKGFKASRL